MKNVCFDGVGAVFRTYHQFLCFNKTIEPVLKSLSTGALDGNAVLYLTLNDKAINATRG